MHLEKNDKFINYLKRNSFKESENLLKYLYSDGTANNTGVIRMSSEEYKKDHQEEIKEINKELEKIHEILIKRFLMQTDVNYRVTVDAIVLGVANDFIWATKEEILKYLCNKKIESTGVHVRGLFLQNWDKNLKYNPKYEKCREYVQVKWYSLFDDIVIIMCERNKCFENKQADSVEYKKKNSAFTKFFKFIWSR